MVKKVLTAQNLEFRVFSYTDSYQESEYIAFMQTVQFAVWLGGHESQGFALQQLLSSNIPILVWRAQNLRQEVGSSVPEYSADTIPYWSPACGEFFYYSVELEPMLLLLLRKIKLGLYHPRQYIVDNLSIEKCESRMLDYLDSKKWVPDT
jgi:hypothetical protein